MRTPETYCPHMAYYFSLPLLVISPRVSFSWRKFSAIIII